MGLIQGKITMANGAEIPFELYPDEAPITVANFVKLIKEGYYNGKTFHRVIPHFVSQGGCPYGTGAGDLGYTIPCETKTIRTSMSQVRCRWLIAARTPAAASSSSAMIRSRIWTACIRSSVR